VLLRVGIASNSQACLDSLPSHDDRSNIRLLLVCVWVSFVLLQFVCPQDDEISILVFVFVRCGRPMLARVVNDLLANDRF